MSKQQKRGQPGNAGQFARDTRGKAAPAPATAVLTAPRRHAGQPPADSLDVMLATVRSRQAGPQFRAGSSDDPVDISRTSRISDLRVDFDTLRRVFGDPLPGDGEKTTAEWHIEFIDEDGGAVVATIYDWKRFDFHDPSPDGPARISSGYCDWAVGGRPPDYRAPDFIDAAIRAAR